MTQSNDSTLSTCGCCETGADEPSHVNRHGQTALMYRIGTHSSFLRRMKARLARQEIPSGAHAGERPLARLTTRAADDASIALLDAWATAADVLTFYQERIANEGFLRTATERRSVLELARAIGYELNPGVAASTFLAFTVDSSDSTPNRATINTGTQVQSIPAKEGELPQTFETTEPFEAQLAWNALLPKQTEHHPITVRLNSLYLQGVNLQLEPGDAILIVGSEREKASGNENWDVRILKTVDEFPKLGHTLVTWQEGLGLLRYGRVLVHPAGDAAARVYVFRRRLALFGHNAPDWNVMSKDVREKYCGTGETACINGSEWPKFELDPKAAQLHIDGDHPEIVAPTWIALTDDDYTELYRVTESVASSQTHFALTGKTTRVALDTKESLDKFGRRSAVVLSLPEELIRAEKPMTTKVGPFSLRIQAVQNLVRALNQKELSPQLRDTFSANDITLGGEASVAIVTLDAKWRITDRERVFEIRLEGGTLTIDAAGNTIALDRPVSGLTKGQPLIVSGKLEDEDEDETREVVVVASSTTDSKQNNTTVVLEKPLTHSYVRSTVTIFANVVPATHGETVTNEVLGSGDGAQTNQRFTLRQSPLTFVAASTASGAASTLEIRVNDVLWQDAPSLYGAEKRDKNFIVRIDDDAKATVLFGDGKSGARLPTGQENVRATYRFGIGRAGEVGEDALSLLKKRPFGVRSVTNPVAAGGASDPEKLEDARTNAPLTVLTLDRIVSLQDFEDFARAFAGIGKAQAVSLWNGESTLVHITVADDDGDPVSDGTLEKLKDAIDDARDPSVVVVLENYDLLTFYLEASVLFDAAYLADKVQPQIEDTLQKTFAFAQRGFGQPVTAAEILSAIHQVDGVIAVDLDALYARTMTGAPIIALRPAKATLHMTGFLGSGGVGLPAIHLPAGLALVPKGTSKPAAVLPSKIARRTNGHILPGQLLLLDEAGIHLTMKTV